MSLFTATSATPERVWALARLLLVLGGRADRALVAGLLDPRFSRGRTSDAESSAFQQTVQAAAGLGLVLREGDGLALVVPDVAPDLDGFADQVHATLCGGCPDGGDTLLLDGFAVLAAECDLEGGMDWLLSSPREALVDRLNARLAEGRHAAGLGMLNTSRLPQWFRWMAFLGLATFLGAGGHDSRPYPYVSPRIARELAGREGLPRGAEVPARDVVAWIARRMPYLEGGSLQREVVAGTLGGAGTRVSMLVSVALRDLHDDGVLRLITAGDAGDNLSLTEDRFHSVAAFRAAIVADRSDSDEAPGQETSRDV